MAIISKIQNFQDKTTTKTRENRPNSAESTAKWGKIVSKIEINLKKQSQYASLRLEILSTKSEILNKLNGCDLKKQSQFVKDVNERKYLLKKGIRKIQLSRTAKKQSQC